MNRGVDLPLQAYNNLFRWGLLFLEPTTNSAGNWTFHDNLFERMAFEQAASSPLDYDYNAYWPCTTSDLNYWSYETGATAAAGLTPTTTGDGTTNAMGDITLSAAPAYQTGPFGRYYLPTSSPTYNAGSQPAANAGLYHYTTRLDQTKEGDEASGHMVNIGLHYIAATNSTTAIPKDTDGDGIPDYVEDSNGNGVVDANETDWTTQYTVTNVWDPTNSVYDDIDLSGNGLVGRIKKALGIGAFDTGNPLTLTQVITGNEPNIATFSLPINYNLLTNVGKLNLFFDGADVTMAAATSNSDSSTLITWNTTFDPAGPHCMQGRITLKEPGTSSTILTGYGALSTYYSPNMLQFYEDSAFYTANMAFLDAQLSVANANYTIQVFDPSKTPETLLYTVTSSSSDGTIQEDWGVTNSDGTPFSGQSANVAFTITPLDDAGNPIAAPSSYYRVITVIGPFRGPLDEFDFAYFYTPPDNSLAAEWDNEDGIVWMGMGAVVDTLLEPQYGFPVYSSTFNAFDTVGSPWAYQGNPGFVFEWGTTGPLYTSLSDGFTGNFYCYGHGSSDAMGDYMGYVGITAEDVSAKLGNTYDVENAVITITSPYTFVFLDGCYTASTSDWRHAFGIINSTPAIGGTGRPIRTLLWPQAFVGWTTSMEDMLGGVGADLTVGRAMDIGYTETLDLFYFQWMSGTPIGACIYNCSSKYIVQVPFPTQNVDDFYVIIDSQGTGVPVPNKYPGRLAVRGHAGLTISGRLITAWEGQYNSR